MTEKSFGLVDVLEALYDSEINCSISISSFWDAGWDVKLGDELNGFDAKTIFKQFPKGTLNTEVAAWLIQKAIEHYPDSEFAKGMARVRASRKILEKLTPAEVRRLTDN